MARALLGLLLCLAGLARAAEPIDVPPWFTETFLDFREDVRDAAAERKRVMLYFGQDGCPYCKALMKAGFGDPQIAAFTRGHFVAIALNLWGDREVTWTDGRRMPEKDLARALKVQYTPTLLFLDEKGGVALRVDGYQPPERLRLALDYVATREEQRVAYADYVARRVAAKRAEARQLEPFVARAPVDIRKLPGDKPILVLLERGACAECDEMHREGFARADVKALLSRFRVIAIDTEGDAVVILPDGRATTERQWARALKVAYAPTLVFLERDGREIFRADGYMRPFHLAATLDYVASGAWREESSLQRFIQKRADAMRAQGRPVELWK